MEFWQPKLHAGRTCFLDTNGMAMLELTLPLSGQQRNAVTTARLRFLEQNSQTNEKTRCGACGQPPACGQAAGNAARFPGLVHRIARSAKAGIGAADCPSNP
jgi:hypothetical protein